MTHICIGVYRVWMVEMVERGWHPADDISKSKTSLEVKRYDAKFESN